MTKQTYQTPLAFKAALESRLQQRLTDKANLNRQRQLLVFDRFLARITHAMNDAVILKGGLVLEMRLNRARTTKDIDIHMNGSSEKILESLQETGQIDLGDFMTFIVQPDAHLPEITGEGIIYEGYRFRVECRLGGKIYGQLFGVDVAFGDPLTVKPDTIVAEDKLSFAGIAPPTLRLYPIVSHIAEKLHAYTMPRDRPNSRVKDLPDLALLATTGPISGDKLRAAIEKTFAARNTHPLPALIRPPPNEWEKPYTSMASRDNLQWKTIVEVTQAVSKFLNPILDQKAAGYWDHKFWRWP